MHSNSATVAWRTFLLTMTLKGVRTAILEKNEVTKNDGKPCTVFTRHNRKWRKILTTSDYMKSPRWHWRKQPGMDQHIRWRNTHLASMGFERVEFGQVVPPRRISMTCSTPTGAEQDFGSSRHFAPLLLPSLWYHRHS